MTKGKRYTVVENAGYEGECDQSSFDSLGAAMRWTKRTYEPDELDSLHVTIAVDLPDGSRTYEY